ncbi:12993_t:CDS:1, partial [Ambispora leptoticha]
MSDDTLNITENNRNTNLATEPIEENLSFIADNIDINYSKDLDDSKNEHLTNSEDANSTI